MRIEYKGKCLLISERGKKILVVGDLHLGYEESLNLSGVFVSRKMFEEMIGYFDRIFDKVGKVEHVILLGDVKHDFGRVLRQEWNDTLGLFEHLEKRLKKKGNIIIVKGNHDKILEPIVRKMERVKLVDFFVIGKYCFVHGDREFKKMFDRNVRVWVMGHGHPAIKISDGIKVEKFKCFLEGRFGRRDVIIVPSFFEYSKGTDVRENDLGLAWDFDFDRFKAFVVGEGLDVLGFGRLGELE